jgi:hypothetical protein
MDPAARRVPGHLAHGLTLSATLLSGVGHADPANVYWTDKFAPMGFNGDVHASVNWNGTLVVAGDFIRADADSDPGSRSGTARNGVPSRGGWMRPSMRSASTRGT